VRLLITGASGMLGATLVKNYQEKYDVYATSRTDFLGNTSKNFLKFDLLEKSYDKLIDWSAPDIILHCGAITDLDYSEVEKKITTAVNANSVKKFLGYGSDLRVILISSDAVFPDKIKMAKETDQPMPQNVYGRSKEIAEKYILRNGNHNLAIRTTIIGKNINKKKVGFLEWIINSINNEKKITLFDDVFFTPITIWNLSDELEWIINNKISGLLHISCNEEISKYDLGLKICEKMGLDNSLIVRGSIDDFYFNAKRSKDQTLDSTYYKSISNRGNISVEDIVNTIAQHFLKLN